MSFLASLVGAASAKPIEAVMGGIDALFTSDEEKGVLANVKQKLVQEPQLAQIALNKMGVQHRTIFVAGWRPFIGWVCGLSLLYNFMLRDMTAWAMGVWAPHVEAPPELAVGALMTILMGMLGLTASRSYEKKNGLSK